jgi:hypothetical protein
VFEFDDSRLDDVDWLLGRGQRLRHLALAGARLRQGVAGADLAALARVADGFRPRAVIVLGPEARLMRAVAEPTCPVPLVAWPTPSLPAWVGSLDLVVILASRPEEMTEAIDQSLRRGAVTLVVAPKAGAVTEHAVGRSVVTVWTGTDDHFVTAVVALAGLEALGLAPAVAPARVADGLDQVAEQCSPHVALGSNPAKDGAVCLADSVPLIWGGSVLAARASRRLAEALRQVTGRTALAADASELAPVLAGATPQDLFADPFDEAGLSQGLSLVCLDDDSPDPLVGQAGRQLSALADGHGVRLATIRHSQGGAVERYACLLQHGLFAAAYLGLGLNRGTEA